MIFLQRSVWPALLLVLPTILHAGLIYVDALSTLAPSDTQTWGIVHAQLIHMLAPANILQQWGNMALLHWRITPALGVSMSLLLLVALRLWFRRASFSAGLLLFLVACLYQEPGYILFCIIHLYLFN